MTDRENQTTTYGYDGASVRLTTITDARGNVAVTNQYDPSTGRVVRQQDARGLVTGQATDFAYGAADPQTGQKTTTVTYPAMSFDPAFRPTETDTYNAQGRLIQRVARPTATESLTIAHTYDANGFRASTTDPRGNSSAFCYDADYAGQAVAGSRGNLTRVIAPPPAAGQIPLVSLYRYDAKNNPTQMVPPKGVANGASVNCATDLSGVVNSAYATDLAYDAAGVQLRSITGRSTDPELGLQTAVTTIEYDVANPGLPSRVIPPRGNTGPTPDASYATTYAYGTGSSAGLLASVTDALGNGARMGMTPAAAGPPWSTRWAMPGAGCPRTTPGAGSTTTRIGCASRARRRRKPGEPRWWRRAAMTRSATEWWPSTPTGR